MIGLTGDLEIDRLVPEYPCLIPELVWLGLDRKRVLVVGTLHGAIFPRRVGSVDIVEFAGEVNGGRSLVSLLTERIGAEAEHRRVILLMWFSHGLLENGTKITHGEQSECRPLVSFISRIADQTRVSNSRGKIQCQLNFPLAVIGAPPGLKALLLKAGLNVREDYLEFGDEGLIIWFYSYGDDFAKVEKMKQLGIPIIICSATDKACRIGPMLLGRNGTSIDTCLSIHSTAISQTSWKELWVALVANAILLVHSRAAPISLFDRYIEYSMSESGIQSETIYTQRVSLQRWYPEFTTEQIGRMLRQTKLASPPPRFIGYKAYEAHYSRKYLAAASQFPIASRLKASAGPDEFNQDLLRVLGEVFGYRKDTSRGFVRNCPTGGNLGSPELVVLFYDARDSRVSLLRYLPVDGSMESLIDDHWDNRRGQLPSFYVVVALGNVAKAQYKYELLGENLVQLDAGVASSFFVDALRCLWGLEVVFEVHSSVYKVLETWLESCASTYVVTWLYAIPNYMLTPVGNRAIKRFDKFVRVSRQRRAWRELAPVKISVERVLQYICVTRPTAHWAGAEVILSYLKILVVHKQRVTDRAYLVSVSNGQIILADVPNLQDTGEFVCQHLLSRAPVKLFFLVNLPALLQASGPSGHDLALKVVGAWVGKLWLELEKDGFRGCPAGAIAESEIIRNLDWSDADRYFNLFSFHFGRG